MRTIEQAFGPQLTTQLLNTYDGSAVQTDTQQDLIGEKYLAEQIKLVQQTKRSVVDRYAHLFYEGDKDYKSNAYDTPLTYSANTNPYSTNVSPLKHQEFDLQQYKSKQFK